jgi:hypothetical protein
VSVLSVELVARGPAEQLVDPLPVDPVADLLVAREPVELDAREPVELDADLPDAREPVELDAREPVELVADLPDAREPVELVADHLAESLGAKSQTWHLPL